MIAASKQRRMTFNDFLTAAKSNNNSLITIAKVYASTVRNRAHLRAAARRERATISEKRYRKASATARMNYAVVMRAGLVDRRITCERKHCLDNVPAATSFVLDVLGGSMRESVSMRWALTIHPSDRQAMRAPQSDARTPVDQLKFSLK